MRRTGRIFLTVNGEHCEHEENPPSDRNVDRYRLRARSLVAHPEDVSLDLISMNGEATFLSILAAFVVLYIVAIYSEAKR